MYAFSNKVQHIAVIFPKDKETVTIAEKIYYL